MPGAIRNGTFPYYRQYMIDVFTELWKDKYKDVSTVIPKTVLLIKKVSRCENTSHE